MSNLQNNTSSYGTIKQTMNFDEETANPRQSEIEDFLKRSRNQPIEPNYFKLSFYGCIVVFFLVFTYLFNISTKVFVNDNSNEYNTENLMSSTSKLQPNSATTTTKPNFILIVADDLAWNSIGYTSSEMSAVTEQLTDLASKGIIMNNFYAQEVCSPSRGSLMTGRYPLTIGMQYGMVGSVAEWGMPLDEITIGEVLKENGYTTHMLGKWHLGYFSPLFLPTARGFDSWIGYANGENYYWSKNWSFSKVRYVELRFNLICDFKKSPSLCFNNLNLYMFCLFISSVLIIAKNVSAVSAIALDSGTLSNVISAEFQASLAT